MYTDVEYDSSGDEADRVTDDGWPWSGEKTHYPPYKRNSKKTNEITLQEQDGKLTTIKHSKRTYTRQGKPEEFYPMNPAKLPHGIALIISNKFFTDSRHGMREGTEKDVRNLRKAFRYLGYEVLIRRDCTSGEMVGFFKPGGLVFQRAKKEHDSFVCCILSHGSSDEVIGADSEPVNIGQKNGVQYEVAHCDSLKKKPKLFFIQACRGSGTDGGIECDSGTENRIQSDFSVVPTKSDYFISYATVQGQKSTRHMDHGSRYVLELCRALVSDGHNSTLSSMQKAVNKSVGEYDAVTHQQPLAEDSLTSSVYFFEDQLKETAV